SEPEAAPQSKSAGLAWEVIEDTLNQLIDFSQPTLDKKLYDKFVSKIIPRGNNRFAWVMNLDNGLTEDFTLVAEGRKSKQTVSVDDSEGGESPLHNIGVIRLADFKKWRKSQKSSPVQFPHRRRLKGRTKQA
ncbi:MAG: hypothetical protein LBD02_05850, partial [Christensenellaceae bacterium]|nr:hypothetical protein [Christensenellaceae bacterium]